ncbi:unnamed protein product, partial [Mesorhabditis spiculigera]
MMLPNRWILEADAVKLGRKMKQVWEIYWDAREDPYAGVPDEEVANFINTGERLASPTANQDVANVISEQDWARNPSERATMFIVNHALDAIERRLRGEVEDVGDAAPPTVEPDAPAVMPLTEDDREPRPPVDIAEAAIPQAADGQPFIDPDAHDANRAAGAIDPLRDTKKAGRPPTKYTYADGICTMCTDKRVTKVSTHFRAAACSRHVQIFKKVLRCYEERAGICYCKPWRKCNVCHYADGSQRGFGAPDAEEDD